MVEIKEPTSSSFSSVVSREVSIPIEGSSMLLSRTLSHEKGGGHSLSLIHISEPTRLRRISYAVFCLKKNLLMKFFLLDRNNQKLLKTMFVC